jgi:hypothetical protein
MLPGRLLKPDAGNRYALRGGREWTLGLVAEDALGAVSERSSTKKLVSKRTKEHGHGRGQVTRGIV